MAFTAYWHDMAERIYQLNCLILLRSRVKLINTAVTWLIGISSCVFSWTWLKGFIPPAICSAIICFFQILAVIFPLLKYGELASALNFAISDIQSNAAAMECFWLKINQATSDSDIADARYQYNQQYLAIEEKYLADIMPKFSRKIMYKASDIRDRYLNEHFLSAESEVKA